MDKRIKTLALAITFSTSAAAWAGDDVASLRNQMNSGNTDAAWKQAQQMRKQYESDAEFDFLYGLLALENGQYNEAQFALERVTLAEPGNVRARFALAKAYYKLGDQHSARRQFEAVKASNPPAYIRRDVNHYLGELEDGRTGSLNGFVEAGLGHDNNVNMATGGSTIANPAFDPLDVTSDPYILLGKNTHQQSDMYNFEQAGLDYYQPIDGDTGIEARGRVARRDNFSSDRYDSLLYRGSASIVQMFGDDQIRGTFTMQDNRLSDSDYQEYYSLAGDWTRYHHGGWTWSAAAFANELRYEDDSLRDIYQYIGNVAAQRQHGLWSHTVGLTLGNEDAQESAGDHNAREFVGAYYDVYYDLSGGHQLFARAYLQNSHQNDEDPFFHQVRDDNFQQWTLGWDWHINKPLRLRTEMVYGENDSDVDYYSYERARLQTGLRYSF